MCSVDKSKDRQFVLYPVLMNSELISCMKRSSGFSEWNPHNIYIPSRFKFSHAVNTYMRLPLNSLLPSFAWSSKGQRITSFSEAMSSRSSTSGRSPTATGTILAPIDSVRYFILSSNLPFWGPNDPVVSLVKRMMTYMKDTWNCFWWHFKFIVLGPPKTRR